MAQGLPYLTPYDFYKPTGVTPDTIGKLVPDWLLESEGPQTAQDITKQNLAMQTSALGNAKQALINQEAAKTLDRQQESEQLWDSDPISPDDDPEDVLLKASKIYAQTGQMDKFVSTVEKIQEIRKSQKPQMFSMSQGLVAVDPMDPYHPKMVLPNQKDVKYDNPYSNLQPIIDPRTGATLGYEAFNKLTGMMEPIPRRGAEGQANPYAGMPQVQSQDKGQNRVLGMARRIK